MPRYSRLAEFARTRGARDKRPRKRRNDLDLLDKEYKGARTNELRTRSIANLGRTLNSVGNSVREVRLTAKWLGIDPSRKRGNDPMSIVRNVRSGSDAGNSLLRLGRGITGTRSRSSRVSLDGGGLIRSATLITGRSGGLFGMRSLSSMMAEFRRGRDRKKRKTRRFGLLGYNHDTTYGGKSFGDAAPGIARNAVKYGTALAGGVIAAEGVRRVIETGRIGNVPKAFGIGAAAGLAGGLGSYYVSRSNRKH